MRRLPLERSSKVSGICLPDFQGDAWLNLPTRKIILLMLPEDPGVSVASR